MISTPKFNRYEEVGAPAKDEPTVYVRKIVTARFDGHPAVNYEGLAHFFDALNLPTRSKIYLYYSSFWGHGVVPENPQRRFHVPGTNSYHINTWGGNYKVNEAGRTDREAFDPMAVLFKAATRVAYDRQHRIGINAARVGSLAPVAAVTAAYGLAVEAGANPTTLSRYGFGTVGALGAAKIFSMRREFHDNALTQFRETNLNLYQEHAGDVQFDGQTSAPSDFVTSIYRGNHLDVLPIGGS